MNTMDKPYTFVYKEGTSARELLNASAEAGVSVTSINVISLDELQEFNPLIAHKSLGYYLNVGVFKTEDITPHEHTAAE